MGGWMDLRAGLGYLEKRKFLTPPGLELMLYEILTHSTNNRIDVTTQEDSGKNALAV
jgi:hypothetical protein